MDTEGFVDICSLERMQDEDEEIIDVVTIDKNPPESIRPLIKYEGFVCKICKKVMRDKAGLTRHLKNLHTRKVPCLFCQRSLRTFGRSDSLRSHLMVCQNYLKVLKHAYIEEMSEEDIKAVTWKYSLELSKKHRLPRNFEEIHLKQMSNKECVYDSPIKEGELIQLVSQYKQSKLLNNNSTFPPGQGKSNIHTIQAMQPNISGDLKSPLHTADEDSGPLPALEAPVLEIQ